MATFPRWRCCKQGGVLVERRGGLAGLRLVTPDGVRAGCACAMGAAGGRDDGVGGEGVWRMGERAACSVRRRCAREGSVRGG